MHILLLVFSFFFITLACISVVIKTVSTEKRHLIIIINSEIGIGQKSHLVCYITLISVSIFVLFCQFLLHVHTSYPREKPLNKHLDDFRKKTRLRRSSRRCE